MSSKSEYNFADWYRSVDNQLTSDIQVKRIDTINKLKANENQSFWLDVIKIYKGIPIDGNSHKLAIIKAFKDEDAIFPTTGNDHLLQTLAGILLCFKLESFSPINTFVGLSILNVNFLGKYVVDTNIPVSNYAEKHLLQLSIDLRNVDLVAQSNDINGLVERKSEENYAFSNLDLEVSTDAISALLQSQRILYEETNILWWLFGEASVIFDEPLKNIGLPKSIAIISKELNELLVFDLGPVKIQSIMQKAIASSVASKVTNRDYSSLELINKFNKEERKLLLDKNEPNTIFTPLLSGFHKANLYEMPVDWSAIYAQEFNNGDLSKVFSPSVLASQIFNEFLFLRCLN